MPFDINGTTIEKNVDVCGTGDGKTFESRLTQEQSDLCQSANTETMILVDDPPEWSARSNEDHGSGLSRCPELIEDCREIEDRE